MLSGFFNIKLNRLRVTQLPALIYESQKKSVLTNLHKCIILCKGLSISTVNTHLQNPNTWHCLQSSLSSL